VSAERDEEDRFLERAVDVLAPFLDAQERAGDRAQVIALADGFRDFRARARQAPTISGVRDEFGSVARGARTILARLNRMNPAVRQRLSAEIDTDTLFRGDRVGRLDVDRLRADLAALAVFADRIRDDRDGSRGGAVNVATAPYGSLLRYLAFHAADLIDCYSTGACGARRRPQLRVSGTVAGPVFALTRNIADHVLGEERPEGDLGKVVERAVADWKRRQERDRLGRLEWEAGRGSGMAQMAKRWSGHAAMGADRDIAELLRSRRP
jgi:hypothetical protein